MTDLLKLIDEAIAGHKRELEKLETMRQLYADGPTNGHRAPAKPAKTGRGYQRRYKALVNALRGQGALPVRAVAGGLGRDYAVIHHAAAHHPHRFKLEGPRGAMTVRLTRGKAQGANGGGEET